MVTRLPQKAQLCFEDHKDFSIKRQKTLKKYSSREELRFVDHDYVSIYSDKNHFLLNYLIHDHWKSYALNTMAIIPSTVTKNIWRLNDLLHRHEASYALQSITMCPPTVTKTLGNRLPRSSREELRLVERNEVLHLQ